MTRAALAVLVPLGIVAAISCGGSAFTAGSTADAGGDVTASPLDAASDTLLGVADTSSPEDTGQVVSDAQADVVEEPPPATCAGAFACVPAVPGGWEGPVELYSGTGTAPSCTANFTSTYEGKAGLIAPAATCTCMCDAPPTLCSVPELSFFTMAASVCGKSSCYTTTLTSGACTTVTDSPGCSSLLSSAMSAPASEVGLSSCTAASGKVAATPTWTTYGQACSSTVTVVQDTCQPGSVCAPTPAAPYGASLCIHQAGNVVCPPSTGGLGYTVQQVFYGDVDDGRGCSACTCGSVTGASCAASFEAYTSTDGTCSKGGDTYAAPFSCDAVGQPADFRLTITPQVGSCQANPVTPTGAATPVEPTTFCCLP